MPSPAALSLTEESAFAVAEILIEATYGDPLVTNLFQVPRLYNRPLPYLGMHQTAGQWNISKCDTLQIPLRTPSYTNRVDENHIQRLQKVNTFCEKVNE